MAKEVVETPYKFFTRYVDALLDSNYFVEAVDVEGGNPPENVDSKTMSGNFRLKHFRRDRAGAKFSEAIYLKNN